MTLILLVIHYIFEDHTQNHVDRAWIKFVIPKSWRKLGTTGWNKWTKAATAALLTYSDSQVITGIAILLAGYWQLRSGISLHHWKVISNLAWFSSVTHLATLTSLRKYFQQRPTLAYCRTTAMGINLILLGIASGPANMNKVHESSWDEGYPDPLPAKCFYKQQYPDFYEFNIPILIFSLTFLVVSYTIRVIRISTKCSRVTRKWLKDKPGDWLKKNHSKAIDNQAKMQNPVQKRLWCFWKRLLTLSYVVLKALCEVGNSMLWEVCPFDILIIHNFTISNFTRLTLLEDSLAPRSFFLGDNEAGNASGNISHGRRVCLGIRSDSCRIPVNSSYMEYFRRNIWYAIPSCFGMTLIWCDNRDQKHGTHRPWTKSLHPRWNRNWAVSGFQLSLQFPGNLQKSMVSKSPHSNFSFSYSSYRLLSLVGLLWRDFLYPDEPFDHRSALNTTYYTCLRVGNFHRIMSLPSFQQLASAPGTLNPLPKSW